VAPDPGTHPPESNRRPIPSGDALVGRERELRTLRYAWKRAAAGNGDLVLVTGDLGVGRTRLVEELGRVARGSEAHILFGGAAAARSPRPNQPWLAALMSYGSATSSDDARSLSAISDIVRAARFAEALTAWLVELSAVAPVLVVLDDLEQADAATLSTLELVAAEARRARLLIAATTTEGSGGKHDAAMRAASGEQLRLTPLEDAAAARLAMRVLGAPLPARLGAELAARAQGNPLFLRHLVALLADEGWLGDEDQALAALRAWRRVQDVIVRRLARLSEPCRRLLELATLQGNQFDVDVLRAMTGDETERFLDRLDEAQRAAMLRPSPWIPGRYQFSHPLVRDLARVEGVRGARPGPRA
jgi:predicted ATPase